MEDIFEELIGEEIYDETDVAVDMRELAKKRAQKQPAVTPSTAEEAASAEEEGSRIAAERPVSPQQGRVEAPPVFFPWNIPHLRRGTQRPLTGCTT